MENNFLKNFKSLSKNKKEKFVSQIFSNVADNYDLMNDLMSFGLHKSWKEKLVSLINVDKESYVLDLAAGSGDLTKLLKDKIDCNCLIYDSNIEMLKNAKKKNKNAQIICGKAENLPFKNDSWEDFDGSNQLKRDWLKRMRPYLWLSELSKTHNMSEASGIDDGLRRSIRLRFFNLDTVIAEQVNSLKVFIKNFIIIHSCKISQDDFS